MGDLVCARIFVSKPLGIEFFPLTTKPWQIFPCKIFFTLEISLQDIYCRIFILKSPIPPPPPAQKSNGLPLSRELFETTTRGDGKENVIETLRSVSRKQHGNFFVFSVQLRPELNDQI